MLIMAVKTFVITVMMTGEGQTSETLCSGQCYHMHYVKNDFVRWAVLSYALCQARFCAMDSVIICTVSRMILCSGQCYHAQCVKNYFLYTLVEHSN